MSNSVTIKHNGASATLSRRTNLSHARFRAIVGKMTAFYAELATELHEDLTTVDVSLSEFAEISAQVNKAKGFQAAAPSDALADLQDKCRAWLIDVDPDFSDQLRDGLKEVNRSWGEKATAPTPLAEDADPQ